MVSGCHVSTNAEKNDTVTMGGCCVNAIYECCWSKDIIGRNRYGNHQISSVDAGVANFSQTSVAYGMDRRTLVAIFRGHLDDLITPILHYAYQKEDIVSSPNLVRHKGLSDGLCRCNCNIPLTLRA